MANSQRAQGELRRILVVRCGAARCGLPAASVRRVLRALPLQPVPGAERKLLGLAQFGGEPLVVLDLLALLGGSVEQGGALPITVVVSVGPAEAAELVGLAVDEALEVVSFDPASATPGGGGLVAGETLVGEHVVRVLDLEALGKGS